MSHPSGTVSDEELFQNTLSEAVAWHERAKANPAPVLKAAALMIECLQRGSKVLFFGNGGSAADAQHATAELVSRFQRERRALAAIALSVDSSVVTAIGNDYAFEKVFRRQIEALGKPGDVAFGISTSGRSPNVLLALQAARTNGLQTIALTGRDGGSIGAAAEVHINVPAASTARAQEVHRTLLHIICELVERAFA